MIAYTFMEENVITKLYPVMLYREAATVLIAVY
jgi:hypothetical protein